MRRSTRPAHSPPAAASGPAAASRQARIASAVDAFRRVIRVLRVAARQAEHHGLSPAQLFVLGQIAARPRQSLSEIAARTLTDRTSVAGMVERLAGRGLVRRVIGEDDRRRVEIELTAAGERLLANAADSPTEHLLEGLEQLDDATLDQLTNGLGALVQSMRAGEGPATMLFEDATPAPEN
jgi:MarR family transcriptional regulator, organic hydroperoxide resistance regulator